MAPSAGTAAGRRGSSLTAGASAVAASPGPTASVKTAKTAEWADLARYCGETRGTKADVWAEPAEFQISLVVIKGALSTYCRVLLFMENVPEGTRKHKLPGKRK